MSSWTFMFVTTQAGKWSVIHGPSLMHVLLLGITATLKTNVLISSWILEIHLIYSFFHLLEEENMFFAGGVAQRLTCITGVMKNSVQQTKYDSGRKSNVVQNNH